MRSFGALGFIALLQLLSHGPCGRQAHAGDSVYMVPAAGDGNKYWPRWRGPSSQGLAGSGDYPDTWSDSQNVLWKADLAGQGNSSPIVWQDRVFLSAAYDAG